MMKRWAIYLCYVLTLTLATPVFAQKFTNEDDDEIPIVSVRKRYFLKTHRTEIGINGSWVANDTFVQSLVAGGSLGYHFNEVLFVEATGGYFINNDSDSTSFLVDHFGLRPNTDDINYYGSAQVGWSPIYGKLSFMGKKIIYFDTSIYGGGGVTDAKVSGLSPHVTVGLAQRFVLTKWLALRLDFKDNVVLRDDTGLDSAIRHVLFITAGLNFFLPVR